MLRYVRNTLMEGGYTPILTGDPNEAVDLLRAEMPHLVLLNLVLPGTDGFELMKQLSGTADVPVIFLSGLGGARYVAKAFEMGAADYVVKPFSPTELLARISAALRRRALSQHAEPYRLGDMVVDYVGHEVTVAGRAAKLTPTEYKLLLELCTNAGPRACLRPDPGAGMGRRQQGRPAARAHVRQGPAPEAGRRRQEPRLPLSPSPASATASAPRRPDRGARGGGARGLDFERRVHQSTPCKMTRRQLQGVLLEHRSRGLESGSHLT